MLVAMVLVMDMLMLVFQCVMNVFMLVPLAQVQPNPKDHQCSGYQ